MIYQATNKADVNSMIIMLCNIAHADVKTIGEVCPKFNSRIIGKSIIA